jgi:hypothetical protein
MQYVDINSVIAEAISITPDTDAGDWAIARQWVVTALMQLGTSEDEINICTIQAINLTLPKPDDMRCYVEMALYDSQHNYIPHIFRGGNRRIYPDNRVTTPLGITGGIIPTSQILHTVPVDVSEDQLNFYLGTNGRHVDNAWVRYFAYPIDDNGLPMIREDEKFAIMTYIQWAKASKKGENQSEIAMKWQMWAKQHDMARARKKSDRSNDMHKTIARFWMKLIPEFNSSRF